MLKKLAFLLVLVPSLALGGPIFNPTDTLCQGLGPGGQSLCDQIKAAFAALPVGQPATVVPLYADTNSSNFSDQNLIYQVFRATQGGKVNGLWLSWSQKSAAPNGANGAKLAWFSKYTGTTPTPLSATVNISTPVRFTPVPATPYAGGAYLNPGESIMVNIGKKGAPLVGSSLALNVYVDFAMWTATPTRTPTPTPTNTPTSTPTCLTGGNTCTPTPTRTPCKYGNATCTPTPTPVP